MRLARLTTVLLTSAVVAPGLVFVASIPAEAATTNTVRASPAKPIVNERFTVTGKLSTSVKRKAYLQLKSAGSWKKSDTDTTSSSGAYKFAGRTKIAREYRIVAPATKIKGKKYKRINGPAKLIRVVQQTASLKVSDLTPAPGDVITLTGTFTPARKGRKVSAFVKVNGSTIHFAPQRQRSSGRVTWKAIVEPGDVDQPANFYVRAQGHSGAAQITSAKVTVTAAY